MDFSLSDEEAQIAEMIDRAMRRMNTCIPGIITAFNAANQRATVQPAIQMKVNIPGRPGYKNLPPTVNVPLVFPFASTAGFALTLPVSAGDPCLLIFSQKAIDNWAAAGGVQPPGGGGLGLRHHSLTDAFCILSPSPLPGVLGSWATDGIAIRNRANTQSVKVSNTQVIATAGSAVLTLNQDGTATLTAPGGLTLPENVNITGTLAVTGNITATGTITPG